MCAQGIAALMALNSLELEEGLCDMGWGSGAHLHAAIESMRLAFADALAYNADPEVVSAYNRIWKDCLAWVRSK